MKIIPLTKGVVAIVDDEDFERLNVYKWYASAGSGGYLYATRQTTIGKKRQRAVLMHREVMNALRGQRIDHRDRNTLDNRKQNLRTASRGLNRANAALNRNNTSGFKGVSWNRRQEKYTVSVGGCGPASAGVFTTAREAAEVYDRVAIERFGEFACTNKQLGLLNQPQ